MFRKRMMKSTVGMLSIGLASTLFFIGCQTSQHGSGNALKAEDNLSVTADEQLPMAGLYIENGSVYRKECKTLNECEITGQTEISVFKLRLKAAYETKMERAMTDRESKILEEAVTYLSLDPESQGERLDYVTSDRFTALLGKYTDLIDQAFDRAPRASQEVKMTANEGFQLQGRQFLDQTVTIRFHAPLQTTPIYYLLDGPVRLQRVRVELRGCQGWRVSGVKVASTGNPIVGNFANVGPNVFASHFGGSHALTHIGFDLVPNPIGLVPTACRIIAYAEQGDGGNDGGGNDDGGNGGGGTIECSDMSRPQCLDNNDRCSWRAGEGLCVNSLVVPCDTMGQRQCDNEYPRCRWSVSRHQCMLND